MEQVPPWMRRQPQQPQQWPQQPQQPPQPQQWPQQLPPQQQMPPIGQFPPQGPYQRQQMWGPPGQMPPPQQPQPQYQQPLQQPPQFVGRIPNPPVVGPQFGGLPRAQMKGKLPSQKKKRTLRILLGLLILTGIITIVTGIYFYLTYVK